MESRIHKLVFKIKIVVVVVVEVEVVVSSSGTNKWCIYNLVLN